MRSRRGKLVRFVAEALVLGTSSDQRWRMSVPLSERVDTELVRVDVLSRVCGEVFLKEVDFVGSKMP